MCEQKCTSHGRRVCGGRGGRRSRILSRSDVLVRSSMSFVGTSAKYYAYAYANLRYQGTYLPSPSRFKSDNLARPQFFMQTCSDGSYLI